MNDKPRLIDANKLLDSPIRVEGLIGGKCYIRAIPEDAIKNAPTIDAVPQWIPVTERLPEEIICFLYVLVTTTYGTVSAATYDSTTKQFYDEKEILSVVAWMPMPKPYQAKMDEKDGE